MRAFDSPSRGGAPLPGSRPESIGIAIADLERRMAAVRCALEVVSVEASLSITRVRSFFFAHRGGHNVPSSMPKYLETQRSIHSLDSRHVD